MSKAAAYRTVGFGTVCVCVYARVLIHLDCGNPASAVITGACGSG